MPRESARICRASRSVRAASRARCLRGVPIRRASGSQAREGKNLRKRRSFAEPAIEDGLIRVDASIAEERPVAASFFAFLWITFDDENLFLIATGLRRDLAERIGDEGVAPEFEARIAIGGVAFVADAIHDGDVRAIGDCMGALNGAPRVELRGTEFGFFFRVPADTGGIKNDLRAAQRGEA